MEQFSQIKDLMPDVLLHCKECPDTIALHSLSHASAEFLRSSGAWCSLFYGDLVKDSPVVPLKDFPNALLNEVVLIKLNGFLASKGLVSALSDGVLYLDDPYIPDRDVIDGLVCSCSLVPDPHAAYIPPRVVREFSSAFIYLALSDILLMPNVPYSNPQLGAYFAQKYEKELIIAKARLSQNRTGVNRGFAG